MPKLYYQGHGSFRLTTDKNQIIYVDPYAGDGYDLPADVILISHNHFDHNQHTKCKQKPTTKLITFSQALVGGEYQSFEIEGISIRAVEAYNQNHPKTDCVGFILTIDGISIYASGDTSKTEDMTSFAGLNLDYAILCGDGIYNMGLEEAAECARLIGARHNIIIHLAPGKLFDEQKAQSWSAPNKLVIRPGEQISL